MLTLSIDLLFPVSCLSTFSQSILVITSKLYFIIDNQEYYLILIMLHVLIAYALNNMFHPFPASHDAVVYYYCLFMFLGCLYCNNMDIDKTVPDEQSGQGS